MDLTTPTGDPNCFPFQEVVGPIDNFPESQWPQCQIPTGPPTAVCAFQYPDPTACIGKSYTIKQYDSFQQAEADNATVIHVGACGVCSNANDMAVRTGVDLQEESILCGVQYSLSGASNRFDELVSCFTNPETVGFTDPCGRLWAHYSATNSYLCNAACASGFEGNVEVNKPPPMCALSDCIACGFSQFGLVMDDIQGFTRFRSGLLEDIIHPCNKTVPLVHDPCPGIQLIVPTAAPSPTSSPSGASHLSTKATTVMLIVVGVLVARML
mmetsp:Transcript_19578/g.45586  ORF Transcript_19578/g.45586 Transcript_19578/m.45586 type:complete len:269 (+) Transcript_19578:219-1025(+)